MSSYLFSSFQFKYRISSSYRVFPCFRVFSLYRIISIEYSLNKGFSLLRSFSLYGIFYFYKIWGNFVDDIFFQNKYNLVLGWIWSYEQQTVFSYSWVNPNAGGIWLECWPVPFSEPDCQTIFDRNMRLHLLPPIYQFQVGFSSSRNLLSLR